MLKKETPLEKAEKEKLIHFMENEDKKQIFAKNTWDKYRQKLRLYIAKNDPRNFLRWEPIMGSMFHYADKNEFFYLTKKSKNDWLPTTRGTSAGNPPLYSYDKKTNGNIIHTAYNLSQLVDLHTIEIKNIHTIVEFGAGYGCMAKLIHNLGFCGKYIIFDIPEFLALQKYFLGVTKTKGNFEFVDEIKKLNISNPDIVIATWSLSESPEELREAFFKKIGKPQYVLIAYQEKFESTDNKKYFQEYQNKNTDYEWKNCEIEHLPKNYYLIGKKK